MNKFINDIPMIIKVYNEIKIFTRTKIKTKTINYILLVHCVWMSILCFDGSTYFYHSFSYEIEHLIAKHVETYCVRHMNSIYHWIEINNYIDLTDSIYLKDKLKIQRMFTTHFMKRFSVENYVNDGPIKYKNATICTKLWPSRTFS